MKRSMQIGGITLELVLGDITEQTVDVIVNVTDGQKNASATEYANVV